MNIEIYKTKSIINTKINSCSHKYINSNLNTVLFVKLFGIVKLYNLSVDILKKLIPLSKLYVLTVIPDTCPD
jgi:hypothetical protein